MPFYVYIPQLKDGRLYVGHSNNPPRRHSEHERGKGCRTTGIFGVNEIIHIEEYPDRPAAARREKQVKGWSQVKKLALALGKKSDLKRLSQCRAVHPIEK
jgi:predicted GIY-YIG superfamily endonuclease